MRRTSIPANNFGAGSELIGQMCRGRKIVAATRKNMTLEDGRVFPRKGNRIDIWVEDEAEYKERLKSIQKLGYSFRITARIHGEKHWAIYYKGENKFAPYVWDREEDALNYLTKKLNADEQLTV